MTRNATHLPDHLLALGISASTEPPKQRFSTRDKPTCLVQSRAFLVILRRSVRRLRSGLPDTRKRDLLVTPVFSSAQLSSLVNCVNN
jgi:hypothetical protein